MFDQGTPPVDPNAQAGLCICGVCVKDGHRLIGEAKGAAFQKSFQNLMATYQIAVTPQLVFMSFAQLQQQGAAMQMQRTDDDGKPVDNDPS